MSVTAPHSQVRGLCRIPASRPASAAVAPARAGAGRSGTRLPARIVLRMVGSPWAGPVRVGWLHATGSTLAARALIAGEAR